MQLAFPFDRGGPNHLSLVEAQANFQKLGASEPRFEHRGRDRRFFRRDFTWRLFDSTRDPFLHEDRPADHQRFRDRPEGACLHYWREDYWLLQQPPV